QQRAIAGDHDDFERFEIVGVVQYRIEITCLRPCGQGRKHEEGGEQGRVNHHPPCFWATCGKIMGNVLICRNSFVRCYQSTWQSTPSGPNCMLSAVYRTISSFTPLGSASQHCQVWSTPSFLSVTITPLARALAMKPSMSSVSKQIWLI